MHVDAPHDQGRFPFWVTCSLHVTCHLRLTSERLVHPLLQSFSVSALDCNMGHTQSSLFGDVSIETVGTVVVVAAAASFAVVQLSSPAAASSQASGSLADKSKTLKKKPKAKGKAKDEQEKVSEVVKVAPAAAEAIPGDFDAPMVDIAVTAPEVSPATTTKKKSKGKKKKAAAASANESQASDASVGASSKPSGDSPAPKPPVAAPVSPPPPQVASLPSEILESTASESDELRVSVFHLFMLMVSIGHHKREQIRLRDLPLRRVRTDPFLLRDSHGVIMRMRTT